MVDQRDMVSDDEEILDRKQPGKVKKDLLNLLDYLSVSSKGIA